MLGLVLFALGGCSGEPDEPEALCIASDCDDLDASCGEHDDGCGGTVDCDEEIGGCGTFESCTDDGQCEFDCTPDTCEDLGVECGEHDDGCGGLIDCNRGLAGCPDPEVCTDGQCVGPECELRDTVLPETTCSARASHCLTEASDDDERQDCLEEAPECEVCFEDAYQWCMAGKSYEPGRCAVEYACHRECIEDECGADPEDACVETAISGTCDDTSSDYQTCTDQDRIENKPCIEMVEDHCRVDSSYDSCAFNDVPRQELGSWPGDDPIFEGNFTDFGYDNDFDGVQCDMSEHHDNKYMWKAPEDGVYNFQVQNQVTLVGPGGTPNVHHSTRGNLEIIAGYDCSPPFESLGCADSTGSNSYLGVQIPLTEGQEVMIAVSIFLSSTDNGSMVDTTEAPYEIWVDKCEPDCSDRECGGDGCGGSCGVCSSSEECDDGICECVPDCLGKDCGGDGCGGSCGECSDYQDCTDGSCVCIPDCADSECGGDGCGGSCGICEVGESCSSGQCQPDPTTCDPIADEGCPDPDSCVIFSDETVDCGQMGSAVQGTPCTDTTDCAPGHACFSDECRQLCELSDDSSCNTPYSCEGVGGWSDYGACG